MIFPRLKVKKYIFLKTRAQVYTTLLTSLLTIAECLPDFHSTFCDFYLYDD